MHVIGTAGHVDHGKSTLVHRLTGIDPDRFEEEKRRGLTIDLGFAWLPLPSGREIGIVDVPGHERFIKNMLAGAGGISLCLFVVAANEGWMPQSAEHLAALEVLGVRSAVVALTKSDTVDQETLDLARVDVEDRFSVTSLAEAPVIACSAFTGMGLDALVAAIDDMVQSTPPVEDSGFPRLWVDRVFTMAGHGTVVTGTLAGGSLSVGEEIEILPEGRRARIRAIQSHKKEVREIGPGNRVALNLSGLERQGAERGDAVVQVGRWRSTHHVGARIRVLRAEISGVRHELSEKGAHLLHIGSAETPVRLRLLDASKVAPGGEAFAHLWLRDPLPVARGDRFVLRDAGRVITFGGGEVLDPMPDRPSRSVDVVPLLKSLAEAGDDSSQAFTAVVDFHGRLPLRDALLRARLKTPPDSARRLGDWVLSEGTFVALQGRLREIVTDHHHAHPLERGIPREEARAALELDPDAFEQLISATDEVVAESARIRLREHTVTLTPEQELAKTGLIEEIEANGFQPPLAKELTAPADLVRALLDSGELVKIGDFYLTAKQAKEARASVRRHIEVQGPVTVAQIRDLLGTSRKYAVPLCEWLDSTGATRRQGDLRALGPHP